MPGLSWQAAVELGCQLHVAFNTRQAADVFALLQMGP